MSNAILEAMAMEKPVVATDVGGTGEIVSEGVTGHLVPARDVLHVRARTDPRRPLLGISPITWAAMARDANLAISATQAAFFANASQPSGFLSTKEKLTPEQMVTLRAAWEDRASGISAGAVPILGGGLEFQQMGVTSQDSQLVEAFGMTVADIARAFAVPLPVIGDLSNATFNNVENLIALWLSQGLGFYVEHLEIALDKFFGLPAGEYVELDTDVLMRTAFKDRIEGLTRAISGGLYSPDEAREREGLPPAPDGFGDEPRLQAQVVPLSQVGKTPPAPSADPAAPPPVDPNAPPPDPNAPPLKPPPDDAAKSKLRGQALDWLQAELSAWSKNIESAPPQERQTILLKLSGWKYDRDFSDIRGATALAYFPVDEQRRVAKLWADVAALLKAENARHGAFLQERLTEARKTLPSDDPNLAALLAQIGRTCLEQEQWAEAEPFLRECLAIREKVQPDAWTTFNTYSSLGESLLGQKKYAEAEPLLLKGYDGMKARESTIPPIANYRLPEAFERLIDLYTAMNKPDDVKKWQAEQANYREPASSTGQAK
jgi:hypothetical protein